MKFEGFFDQTFSFLADVENNNRRSWFEEKKSDFEAYLDHPLRLLAATVGPRLLKLYPDFDVEVSTDKVISRMVKIGEAETEKGVLSEFYWAAFSRHGVSKEMDVQLCVVIFKDKIEVGLRFGKESREIYKSFGKKILEDQDLFIDYVMRHELARKYKFANGDDVQDVTNKDRLAKWLGEGSARVLKTFSMTDEIVKSEAFAEEVYQIFYDLFPLYDLAVNDLSIADTLKAERQEVSYSSARFEEMTGYGSGFLSQIEFLLDEYSGVLLTGAPGTGKTYLARELASYLSARTEKREQGSFYLLPVSPATSFDEMVMNSAGKPGPLGRFIDSVRGRRGNHILILDRLDCADMTQLGELAYLLAERDAVITLPCGKKFSLPDNLYVIGTARDFLSVDPYLSSGLPAVELRPSAEILERWRKNNRISDETLSGEMLTKLNIKIRDLTGGQSKYIGHGFFMKKVAAEKLQVHLRGVILPEVARILGDNEKALKLMKEVFPGHFV